MFAVEIPAIPFYVRLSGLMPRSNRRSDAAMDQKAEAPDLICEALAEMVPSTAEEIAAATGLDPAVAEANLDRLTARCRVMFNPLTKRYSLPKARSHALVAAQTKIRVA